MGQKTKRKRQLNKPKRSRSKKARPKSKRQSPTSAIARPRDHSKKKTAKTRTAKPVKTRMWMKRRQNRLLQSIPSRVSVINLTFLPTFQLQHTKKTEELFPY